MSDEAVVAAVTAAISAHSAAGRGGSAVLTLLETVGGGEGGELYGPRAAANVLPESLCRDFSPPCCGGCPPPPLPPLH